jgi:LysM repeat protein
MGGTAHAAPKPLPVQVAIGNPLPNSLIGGSVSLSVAYNAGLTKIAAFTIYVDDEIYTSRSFMGLSARGVHDLEIDTQNIPNGAHTIRIVAVGSRGMVLGEDIVKVNIRNSGAGAPDIVPPLVHFRGLMDGDEVSGKLTLDVTADDNVNGRDLLVSIFVNRMPKLIRNFPPFTLDLDTAQYLNPATGVGSIQLEALAFDKAGNQGKARPLTLRVRQPGPGNLTPAQGDPTLADTPLVTKSMPPDMAPRQEPVAEKIGLETTGTLASERRTIPRPGEQAGGEVAPVAAVTPRTVLSVKKRPVAAKRSVRPGVNPSAAPATSAAGRERVVAKATPLQTPEIAPLPSVSAPETEPTSTLAPSPIMARPGELVIPVPAPMPSVGGTRGGIDTMRDTPAPTEDGTPAHVVGVKPAGEGEIPAVAPSAKTVKAARRNTKPGLASRKMAAAPRITPRATNPETGSTVVLVPSANATPSESGRVPMEVWTLKPTTGGLPKDRTYKVKAGDTVEGMAKRFRVTQKSILVANGITTPKGMRSGSIIKIPGTFDVVMNDRRIAFDVAPRVENGLPLAPFRQIFEHSGGVVVYYPDSQEVRAANSETEVKLKIGAKEAMVNQVIVVLDRAAFVDSGRTIVPITFMEKTLNLKAEYDVRTGTIMLAPK